jgi:hypothetical protein
MVNEKSNSGMTEYINLELSGNDKRDHQLTERQNLHTTTVANTPTTSIASATTTTTTTTTKTNASLASTVKVEHSKINIGGTV